MKNIDKMKKNVLFSTEAYTRCLRAFRRSTTAIRTLPNFLIIGGQKCGTTSLYHYLSNISYIIPTYQKALHFFDTNTKYSKGINYYKSNFPTFFFQQYLSMRYKQKFLTGEASAYYLFHPHACRRVFEVIPKVKLIILLRNPIDRAFSHYHHMVRHKHETLPFEKALEKEPSRLSGVKRKMLMDENYESYNYNVYSYLRRGAYIKQLKHWMEYFQRDQFLILGSEDFFNDPRASIKSILSFLELPDCDNTDFIIHNRGGYADSMKPETREFLANYFQPYNQQLYDYLGVDFGWE